MRSADTMFHMTSSDWIWLGVGLGALIGVAGGLWVDWKLNWRKEPPPPEREPRGFEVSPPDPVNSDESAR
jgi:hypothetical protein